MKTSRHLWQCVCSSSPFNFVNRHFVAAGGRALFQMTESSVLKPGLSLHPPPPDPRLHLQCSHPDCAPPCQRLMNFYLESLVIMARKKYHVMYPALYAAQGIDCLRRPGLGPRNAPIFSLFCMFELCGFPLSQPQLFGVESRGDSRREVAGRRFLDPTRGPWGVMGGTPPTRGSVWRVPSHTRRDQKATFNLGEIAGRPSQALLQDGDFLTPPVALWGVPSQTPGLPPPSERTESCGYPQRGCGMLGDGVHPLPRTPPVPCRRQGPQRPREVQRRAAGPPGAARAGHIQHKCIPPQSESLFPFSSLL